MINRHIRHDWNTFVEWDQRSVRTVCGVTTRRHLAGIPAITVQPATEIDRRGRKRYGWCVRCIFSAYRQCGAALNGDTVKLGQGTHWLHPKIRDLYLSALTEMYEVVKLWNEHRNNLPPA